MAKYCGPLKIELKFVLQIYLDLDGFVIIIKGIPFKGGEPNDGRGKKCDRSYG
jgi:hypothetical protein